MPPSIFDLATAVHRRDGSPGEIPEAGTPQRYRAEVADGWDIGGHANGGYLLAIIARAMATTTGRGPLSLTAHYLAPVTDGEVEVLVTPVRIGRRMATAIAEVRRDGRPLITAVGTFGARDGSDALLVDGAPPEIPPYDDCTTEPLDDPAAMIPPLVERLAVRMRPGDEGFRSGSPTGRAEMVGWFAFADQAPIDEIGLMLVADAFAPPIFNSGLGIGWAPTLELTVHVRATPAPGPLRCRFTTRFIQGGLLDEDGEIWDADGVLVAQCRQLALVPRV